VSIRHPLSILKGMNRNLLFLVMLSELPYILIGGLIASLFGAIVATPAVMVARWRRKCDAHTLEYFFWNFLGGTSGVLVPTVVGFMIGAGVPDESAGEVATMLATIGVVGGLVGSFCVIFASVLKPPKKLEPPRDSP